MTEQSNGFGIASLVLGIGSIVFSWVMVFGLALGIVGIVLAAKQRKEYPNGIATGGLVTSIIGTVFSAIVSVLGLIGLAVLASL